MHFQFEHTIQLPRTVVFAFYENPANLEVLHSGWSSFRMIRHEGKLHLGCRFWVETTVAGIFPVVMGFENTLHEPPQRFGEQIVHGPFSTFSHIHEFDELNNLNPDRTEKSINPVKLSTHCVSGPSLANVEVKTIVRDLMDIKLPWYYGGEIAMKLFVAPMLERTFKSRSEASLHLAQDGTMNQIFNS